MGKGTSGCRPPQIDSWSLQRLLAVTKVQNKDEAKSRWCPLDPVMVCSLCALMPSLSNKVCVCICSLTDELTIICGIPRENQQVNVMQMFDVQ